MRNRMKTKNLARNLINSVTPVRRGPLLTQSDVAEMISISPRTLEMWRIRGGGPPFLKLRGSIRYDLREIEAWLDGQARRSTSDDGATA